MEKTKMNIREVIEEREKDTFSKFATLSVNSKGRETKEQPDDIRTCFAVDKDRILYSKAFRRLKGKTQVFVMPLNDHYMNRMTHTLEVAQVARTIAVALNLNETLAEAISYAHDCAHTAFGHAGEESLNSLNEDNGGYSHEENVIRRLEYLEKHNGKRGLNLSWEVLDGAVNHSGFNNLPSAHTKEGMIIPFADKIVYLVSDMENAINAGIIDDIPVYIKSELGNSKGHMMDTMIKDIIYNSGDIPTIRMSAHMFDVASDFRTFMFENVYFSKICRDEADKAIRIVHDLFLYLLQHPEEIPDDYVDEDRRKDVTDYISSMTDIFCLNLYKKYFLIQR